MMPHQPSWLQPRNWRETDGDWSCRSRHPPLIGQGVLRALLALILNRIFGRNGPRKFNHNAPTKRRADLPNTPTEVRKRFGAKSGSCGVRQRAEYRENERFALEVVGLNIARGAIDLFPSLRDPWRGQAAGARSGPPGAVEAGAGSGVGRLAVRVRDRGR